MASGRPGPRVALVLGGGGIRGFAHVGVLQALEKGDIRPDIVVGTSAGAVVGAAYASGLSAEEIDRAASKLELSSLLDWTLDRRGFIRGNALAKWVSSVVRVSSIEDMPIRFAAVATELPSGTAVLIDRGDVGSAIRASASVPGVVVPMTYGKGTLIDGGIASLVPVRFARALGADIVIAVDVYCNGPSYAGTGMLTIMVQVTQVQSCIIGRQELAEADVQIAPAVDASQGTSVEARRVAKEAGFAAAEAEMPMLARKLHQWRSGLATSAEVANFRGSDLRRH